MAGNLFRPGIGRIRFEGLRLQHGEQAIEAARWDQLVAVASRSFGFKASIITLLIDGTHLTGRGRREVTEESTSIVDCGELQFVGDLRRRENIPFG